MCYTKAWLQLNQLPSHLLFFPCQSTLSFSKRCHLSSVNCDKALTLAYMTIHRALPPVKVSQGERRQLMLSMLVSLQSTLVSVQG